MGGYRKGQDSKEEEQKWHWIKEGRGKHGLKLK